LESFYEIIQQNEQWSLGIIFLISIIWSALNYRKNKRIMRELQRESHQSMKEYYDCFDDDGNYIEGKTQEYMKKQKERYNTKHKKHNNYTDDRLDKPHGGYFW
tara:strand:- start:615 stop:923 length:309 start_codon:yes stop_codon:yes gene_type:complete